MNHREDRKTHGRAERKRKGESERETERERKRERVKDIMTDWCVTAIN